MCSVLVIIGDIRAEDPLQMPLVEYDDVVETFSTDTTNQAFDVWILPWRSRRRDDVLNVHVIELLAEEVAVDRVTISKQEPRRCVIRKGLRRSAGPSSTRSDGP